MRPILLICAAEVESTPVLERLVMRRELDVAGRSAFEAELAGREVVSIVGGMGKTNAAISLTAALQRWPGSPAIGFGVAGAYPGSGLTVGDLAVATSEHYGDEGALTPNGWISCEGIGIPLFTTRLFQRFNDFPLDRNFIEWAARRLGGVAAGPFVTVSCCSGTAAAGERLQRHFEAICETMEGAAYAHTAERLHSPFLEIRGISNHVEDRDLSRWGLGLASQAVASALETLVSRWEDAPLPGEEDR